MSFKPGARVVYPAYGAGTIIAVEDKVFSGTSTLYYILRMVADEGEFMVPVDQAESLGVRPVLDRGAIQKELQTPPGPLPEDYKERQAEIEQLLSSSDAIQMSLGARNLAWFSGSHPLTGRDVQLYEQLQTQLASEMALTEDIDLEEAREQIIQLLTAITERAQAVALVEAEAEDQAG